MGSMASDMRMQGKGVLRQGPQREGRRRRHLDQILQAGIPFFAEPIDFQELFLAGIAAQPVPVRDHAGGEIGTDAGEGFECRRVRPIQVQLRNHNEGLEPAVDRIRYDIRLCEIFLPVETPAFTPVPVDGGRLGRREPQALQVFL